MKKQSKFLALVLRHDPSAGNLTLDGEGWAPVAEVMRSLRDRYGPFSRDQLQELVDTNDKKRYAFNDRGDKIRAVQGHSIDVDLKLIPELPPSLLYHGTKKSFMGSILHEGLKPMKRQHVHLNETRDVAETVAARRAGDSVILAIDATMMSDHVFYQAQNGVWLTASVPPQFLRIDYDHS